MLRQSPSRSQSHRCKKLRPRHSFQAFLLFAVGVWIVYQLTRSSYGKRRGAVVVETDDDGSAIMEPAARRRLGRKGFVGFAGHIVGADVGGHGAGWDAASSSDDPLSKAEVREGDGDGEEEDQEAGEDDTGDDADDGLAGGEEDDDADLLMSPNGDSEDEMEPLLGGNDRATLFGNEGSRLHDHEPKEFNASAVPREKATARVQDAAASQRKNSTDGAAEGRASATPLSFSGSQRNASPVNLSLHEHDRGTAGDAAAAEKLVANGFAVGAENEKHTLSMEDKPRMTNRKETADSVVVQGIST